ncbi:MAG: hypothetical protein KA369_11565 [Spirochaetes bacterium]|nr:hypothetical protein [Spirochaetota bacterium]
MKKKHVLVFLVFQLLIFFNYSCNEIDFLSLNSHFSKKNLLFLLLAKNKTAVQNPVSYPAATSDKAFVFGVWLQGPENMLNGKTIAQNYKDIGINTFIDLWNWPSEKDMYPGYAIESMQALKDSGMNVYAGNDAAAVNWIKAHPEFWDIFKGYVLGDEPDMNRNSGIQSQADANTPLAWKALGDSLLALDNTREVYANFGKPFAKDAWYTTDYGQTGSQESDFELYVTPTSVISSDFYGITDPWENPENHGIWTYGRAVRNTRKYANYGRMRPVWGFVEASAPWTNASNTNWMFQRMPPSYIMPIAWNMVINGAKGILYFCHDFSPNSLGSYAALLEPGMPAAIKAANESIRNYEAVLTSPDISGTTVSTDGPVNVITLTKRYEGDTFIFAMGDGNPSYRNGLAVNAQITIAGEAGIKNVSVLNDNRVISMNDGKINDHFEPYELHIYKIDN